ncbi:glycosyltransferase family 2 protein [Jannaschia sp. Os4]|uniref:glycosyltransferase family 2 protein n=1 Tax=Jannaschia sp. Os4 TaxID=2807617 RepID=UPI00193A1708|nr:glycosyltransferase family 2 protein [Jannaschia sp. Os4]MBM2575618.1 glycosyltransferase family 2 protein [Jannaschia sp. Os4]
MGILSSYQMRIRRRRHCLRARRKSRELRAVVDRTGTIRRGAILAMTTLRNERVRLPFFLDYHRRLGVGHFLMVDNGSDDGSADYLREQPDVSLWRTGASYKASRFGMDWLNWLGHRHCHGHWTLTVDPDEFLVFPFCDVRPLKALTDWLDGSNVRSFGAMLLDMYPKGPIDAQPYREGDDPFEIAAWFDGGNYMIERNATYGNLWIQGGPRARAFFADRPKDAPALNKTPLVRWRRGYAYLSSTHTLLPRGLNQTYDRTGGEKATGVLLHAKFLDTLGAKATEEMERGQHYRSSTEYRAYAERGGGLDLWTEWSERYVNWRQLEILGLMSKGNWA